MSGCVNMNKKAGKDEQHVGRMVRKVVKAWGSMLKCQVKIPGWFSQDLRNLVVWRCMDAS